MEIIEGKLYFIKDEFIVKYNPKYHLMENKDEGTKRPTYFCFRDKKDKEILWFVPMSSKYDKYLKIYEINTLPEELMVQVIDFIEYLKLSHIDQKAPNSVTIKNKTDLKEKLQIGLDDIKSNKAYSVDEVFTNLDNI